MSLAWPQANNLPLLLTVLTTQPDDKTQQEMTRLSIFVADFVGTNFTKQWKLIDNEVKEFAVKRISF